MTREQAEAWIYSGCTGGEGHRGGAHRHECRACLLDALTASPGTAACVDCGVSIHDHRYDPETKTALCPASPAQGEARRSGPRCGSCGQTLIEGFHYATLKRLASSPAPEPERDRCIKCHSRIMPQDFAPGEPIICLECSSPAPEPRAEVLTFGVQGRDTPEVRELVGAAASMLRRRCEKPDEVCAPFVGDGPCTLCGDWEDEQRAIRRGHAAPLSEKERTCAECGRPVKGDGSFCSSGCANAYLD